MTLPDASVTRRSASIASFFHSSLAVSKMVAASLRAECGAHVRHLAQGQAHGSQQPGPRFPQRLVGLDTGADLVFHGAGGGIDGVAQHDPAREREQQGDRHGSGEQDLPQQRQA
jgi:hypothetical protein